MDYKNYKMYHVREIRFIENEPANIPPISPSEI